MNRYVCIHGHFYQPPRENPWLEEVEVQDSAHPYHDWNERITAECYGPNSGSRILDGDGRIVEIVNNYSKISFNFGPTLLSWMQRHHPKLHQAIVDADRLSMERFDGHGAALAQAYGHMILPLASSRDKVTQVRWGVADFRRRFGRRPEGMWLPETAVDLETLAVLADAGLRFTILAPNQASRVRGVGEDDWRDVSGGRVDPTTPYLVRLPDGRDFTVFFYDGPLSRDMAFGDMLDAGEAFFGRLTAAFTDEGRNWPQLVHVATDGETYGHHHAFGEMALTYCLSLLEADPSLELINYAAYLDRHPPAMETEIFENSSWSCIHGLERWRADCGCNSGMHGHWHQKWRAPLREAMDVLRDRCAAILEAKGPRFFRDPWAARDAYIDVVNDRSEEGVAAFFSAQGTGEPVAGDRVAALELMEMTRCAMLAYTSCGWFFDEVSGIETVQVLQYAARTIQLAEALGGQPVEEAFAAILERAPGNVLATGREAYERYAKPAAVDIMRAGAHYAISSLFEAYDAVYEYGCYRIHGSDLRRDTAGRAQLLTGRADIASGLTGETLDADFAVVHAGGHNLTCGLRPSRDTAGFAAMEADLRRVFARGDLTETVRVLDSHFDAHTFSLRHLFRDEQRKVVGEVLAPEYQAAEAMYRRIFEDNYPILSFLQWLSMPLPRHFLDAAAFVVETDLRRLLGGETIDFERLDGLLQDAARFGLVLDFGALGLLAAQWINRRLAAFGENHEDAEALAAVRQALDRLGALPMGLSLWKAQNVVFELSRCCYPPKKAAADGGDAAGAAWVALFAAVAQALKVRLPQ
ncbi:DUF3536 domain-containing protein [Solidesulfovibrio sp.]|uniref:DUF3536 domain-containing protein n=1 Tax=Solidesulfovibrio sp. TaxID=2910990 RepID=UPI002B21BD5C|nr:DUF3536 domain-containing protein [Solidesulfovibrio sp.]MEA4857416.1 DUF3536 domain-containing protein [Solidesulfovibrio sp.]